MKKLLALIPFIFSFAFLLFLSPEVASATVLFQDNFDDGNADGWEVIRGTWEVRDKRYGTRIETPFTLAETQVGEYSWTDYEFEVDLYVSEGCDRNLFFRSNKERSIYGNGVWNWPTGYGLQIIPTKIHLIKFLPTKPSYLVSAPFSFPLKSTHRLKAVVRGKNIKIYGDNKLLIDFIDNTQNPFLTGRIALAASTGTVYPSEVWYDNVVVTSLEPEPTPTPTPTSILQPIVLLPGLGGSWNHQEIFLGDDQPQSAWYKTPFRNDYDGLIQTLQNAGYALDENLFIFYYDWLQSIAQSATDLKNYIDTVVNPPSETKVDLIGHSLGGLVGRTYIQNNPGSHDVNKLITLGSPHKGVPQVYKAWEGADLHELLGDKERIGAGILLRLRGFSYPNLVQAIQNFVPSLGNLLFIDDYLKWDKTEKVKPESSMSQQNTWLKGLGTSPELLDLTDTILGTAGDTPRWLKIVERGRIDKKLGQWEDGKTVGEEPAIGDRTVLEESAELTGANIITLAGLDHGALVQSTAGQEKILELLGFSGVEIVEQPEIPFEPALVFTVASPVTLRVTDPLGRQIEGETELEKIIIIPQAIDGKYKVEVINENDGGSYKLLIGQLTQKQDLWTTYQGEVTPSRPDTYTLPFDSSLQTTDTYLANLINSKLKNLLRQIRRQKIGFRVKARLTSKVFRILGRTGSLPILLKLKRDRRAARYNQEAILKTTNAINYAEKFNPNSLPPLREILDLLGQLHQLLES